MTQKHPITPPPELVEQWRNEWHPAHGEFGVYIATQAARWSADQELEACCEWLVANDWKAVHNHLRTARRPKPPSLKEQALEELHHLVERLPEGTLFSDAAILRAIESLPS